MNRLKRPKTDILDLLISREYRQSLEKIVNEHRESDQELVLVYQSQGD